MPSRLYTLPTPEKPLNGKRISVKDCFHLKGIITTIGNGSFAECYYIQSHTAYLVRTLIDQGAIIVGKTKMAAFASSEVDVERCSGFLPSWNYRGDGYLTPSGGSMGAGSSIAEYHWLDYAIATDSERSISPGYP